MASTAGLGRRVSVWESVTGSGAAADNGSSAVSSPSLMAPGRIPRARPCRSVSASIALPCSGQQRPDALRNRLAGQPVVGVAGFHGNGHELGLGSVVQVAFDLCKPGVRILHRVAAAFLQDLHTKRGIGRAEQGNCQPGLHATPLRPARTPLPPLLPGAFTLGKAADSQGWEPNVG